MMEQYSIRLPAALRIAARTPVGYAQLSVRLNSYRAESGQKSVSSLLDEE